jgi:type I restriction enzyme S subunit
MANWKKYKFGEIAEIVMGQSPTGETCNESGNGIPLLNGPTEFGSSFPTPVQFTTDPKKFAMPFDILFCVRGSTTGRMNWADRDYAIGRGLAAIRHREGKKYRHFIKGLIDANLNLLLQSATGSTFPNVSKDQLNNISILAPDLGSQETISEILSSLDDKIELNNQINKNLEALAQALFKQWFVDFEFPNENGQPYKSSGGEMVESELGDIPKGWKIYSMNELLETISKTFPLKKVKEVVFLNTGDIQEGKFLHNQLSDSSGLPGQAKKSIEEGDILYSEIRPINKRFAYVYFDASQYVVSTKLMVLRSKVELNSLFQYFVLTQNENIEYLQHLAESRSGTFPQITFSELSTIKIALPNFQMVNEFVDRVLKPYYDYQFSVKNENEELSQLRDALLPKLISGKLEVSESLTEEVM